MMNLGLVLQKQAENTAAHGNLERALDIALRASDLMDKAKPLLETSTEHEDQIYADQYAPLRLQCHRIIGSIYAGMKKIEACENEFRTAIANFPEIPGSYQMLARVLEVQGKSDEALNVRSVMSKIYNS